MVASEATSNAGSLRGAKEIKVKIPLDYHIKLHTLKVLKGQSISDTVERALQKYFDDFATDEHTMHAAATARSLGVFTV